MASVESISIALADGRLTVADLLRQRAVQQPDRLAFAFLTDGEAAVEHLDYGGADRRARAVAAAIRDAGGRPGTRVVLVLPPGLDYVTAFLGCQYAGVIAVPVYPPDPFRLERTVPRLRAVVRDAAAEIALTTAPLLGFLDQVAGLAPELAALRTLAVDAVPDVAGDDGDPWPAAPETTALLQYTSGSTADPRGVVLSHANLLHNSGAIQRVFGSTPESVGLSWLPPYHDMGLIGGLLQPLYSGFPVVLMSPLHFLEQPARWLRAVDRFGATISGGPNFAFDLCVRKTAPAEIERLDLSSWRVAFNGAEPIRPETLERFAAAFAPSGFRESAFLPCYGLAEATLIVSGAEPGGPVATVTLDRAALADDLASPAAGGPVTRLVCCGPAVPGQRVVIAEPTTGAACEPGRVGEIWVAGPSTAAGYWADPAGTARTFEAGLPGDDGRFLRTGDLGFLHDGQLVVTGRHKDVVVVRGSNHYPQDIEATAEGAHPGVRPGSAVAFTEGVDDPDGALVVVLEPRRAAGETSVAELAARVRQAVAQEHGLAVRTVVLAAAGAVPKTSSGKVQRQRCRGRFLAGELAELGRDTAECEPATGSAAPDAAALLAAPRPERAAVAEAYLRGCVAAVADPSTLDRAQPLTALGLDSLDAVQLAHRLQAELGPAVSASEVLGGASLAELAERLVARLAATGGSPPAAPRPVPGAAPPPDSACEAPAALSQRWMWLLQNLEPRSSAYTIPIALRLPDGVDARALRRALDTLVARHPILRTTFPERDGRAVQLVHPPHGERGRAAFAEHDTGDLGEDILGVYLARAARRPFDLASGPLVRVDLYRGEAGAVLLVCLHHIVTDFWSTTILTRELGACYTAYTGGRDVALPPLAATFADVAERQLALLADEERLGELSAYWNGQLGGEAPRLRLPGPAPAAPSRGGSLRFALSADLARRLRGCAAAEQVTPFMLLLSALQAVLHRYTGQPELVVGTDTAARGLPDFADVVGCCTNPVVICSTAGVGEAFRTLLHRTRQRVVEAIEHQEYPIMLLAAGQRTRRPLFDVLFTFNRSPRPGDDLAAAAVVGAAGVRRSLGSLVVETFPFPPVDGGLPIELVMAEVGGVPHGQLRYRGGSLDASAAEDVVGRFVAVLERVADDPGTPIGDLA